MIPVFPEFEFWVRRGKNGSFCPNPVSAPHFLSRIHLGFCLPRLTKSHTRPAAIFVDEFDAGGFLHRRDGNSLLTGNFTGNFAIVRPRNLNLTEKWLAAVIYRETAYAS